MSASGFCGSVTTFSSWQLEVFLSWVNSTPVALRRLWIYDIVDGLGLLIFTVGISTASLSFGFKLSTEFAPAIFQALVKKHRPPSRAVHTAVSIIAIAAYAVTIPLYFVLPATFRPKATAAMLFSFPGAFVRYTLSVSLNPKKPSLPLGTLTANTLGSALLAAFYVAQRGHHGALSSSSCDILHGLADGFCGCLTTVSTFATELRTLDKWNAWRYALISILLGQSTMVVVLGSSIWSNRIQDDVVCPI